MEITCPACKTTDVERMAVTHARGTSIFSGFSVGLDDVSEFHGVTQTTAAARAKPMQQRATLLPLAIALICGIVSLWSLIYGLIPWSPQPVEHPQRSGNGWVDEDNIPAVITPDGRVVYSERTNHHGMTLVVCTVIAIIFAIPAAGLGYQFWTSLNFNSRELPLHLKSWNKQWVCKRCGNPFRPPA